jgi:transcriptional regulator with XRE-family HTH domain
MSKPATIIARYRKANGLTKAKLAEQLGVARATVTRYEAGTRLPARNLLPRFSKILGVSEAALAGLESCRSNGEPK